MELVFQNGLFRRSIMTLTSYFQGVPIYRRYQCNLETFLLHKQEWQKKWNKMVTMCVKIIWGKSKGVVTNVWTFNFQVLIHELKFVRVRRVPFFSSRLWKSQDQMEFLSSIVEHCTIFRSSKIKLNNQDVYISKDLKHVPTQETLLQQKWWRLPPSFWVHKHQPIRSS